MKTAAFLTLSAAAALAAALPAGDASASRREVAEYKWHVSGWEAGCSRGGCYYNFNVSGESSAVPQGQKDLPAGVKPPAFKAYCSGGQPYFDDCTLLSSGADGVNYNSPAVSARLFPDDSDPSNATIGISYAWTQQYNEFNGPRHNFTGYAQSIFNQFAAPNQEFDVTPTQATALL